jgi:pyruvate/2-oxoglutarate/acetoin dehydrogenase E1 component
VTGPDAPAPASAALERAFMPQAESVIAAITKMLKA